MSQQRTAPSKQAVTTTGLRVRLASLVTPCTAPQALCAPSCNAARDLCPSAACTPLDGSRCFWGPWWRHPTSPGCHLPRQLPALAADGRTALPPLTLSALQHETRAAAASARLLTHADMHPEACVAAMLADKPDIVLVCTKSKRGRTASSSTLYAGQDAARGRAGQAEGAVLAARCHHCGLWVHVQRCQACDTCTWIQTSWSIHGL